ncbi:DNA cytosine methyltransferase, partial [Aggregatibacter sp.]
MSEKISFLDLFAGAGGLSEGFIQAGFNPIAHIESDKAACFTLKTRMAYHWLKSNKKEQIYVDYLNGRINRNDFYNSVPKVVIDSIINKEISEENLNEIFSLVDILLDGKKLDLIVGGPPCQAYSLVGRSRDTNKMIGDRRNYLYIFYGEFLKRYKPK